MAAPLILPLVSALGSGLSYLAAEKALSKFLTKEEKALSHKSHFPTSRKVDTPAPKRSAAENALDLVSLTADIALIRNGLDKGISGIVKKGAEETAKKSAELTKSNTDLKKLYEDAPLLKNQLYMKENLESITEALNNNMLANVALFGNMDANLISISTAINALNRTVIDFSSSLSTASDLFTMNTELAMTPRSINDLDGNIVAADMSPYELDLARKVASARELTDTNNLGSHDVMDIDDILEGVEDIDVSNFFKYMKMTDTLLACVPDDQGNYPEFDWSVLNG